ncbi:MAG TPA: pseudouridine synthase [Ornithinimicrobium sp.]|uniref:pseudouridine synthase n=1 Tax=Ornithinimicrobium sp. TaxID=1977084 RepID=UPI002B48E259|nr:pseudouridine synthase [Ornithinimicrobium sp.]HKJ12333.1 pseudouridine synthase [Ornithinimicrobium sp.]
MPPGGPWATVVEFLRERTGTPAESVHGRVEAGEVVLGDGTVVDEQTGYRGGEVVFLYRDVQPEVEVPFELDILHQDDDIVVVDKPHFLATMPRGAHVSQTVVTRLRQQHDLPRVVPAHRLDRLTAGVMLLVIRPELRGAYQQLFAERLVHKTYLALAPRLASWDGSVTVSNRLVKQRGQLQARVVPGEPNARTFIERLDCDAEVCTYRLTPYTGRTHQLRVHCAGLGMPILGDPLYPQVRGLAVGDFSEPLQLLSQRLEFKDPVTGEHRVFTTERSLSRG